MKKIRLITNIISILLIICIFIDVGLSSIITGFPVWPLYLLLVLIAAVIIGGIIASVRAR